MLAHPKPWTLGAWQQRVGRGTIHPSLRGAILADPASEGRLDLEDPSDRALVEALGRDSPEGRAVTLALGAARHDPEDDSSAALEASLLRALEPGTEPTLIMAALASLGIVKGVEATPALRRLFLTVVHAGLSGAIADALGRRSRGPCDLDAIAFALEAHRADAPSAETLLRTLLYRVEGYAVEAIHAEDGPRGALSDALLAGDAVDAGGVQEAVARMAADEGRPMARLVALAWLERCEGPDPARAATLARAARKAVDPGERALAIRLAGGSYRALTSWKAGLLALAGGRRRPPVVRRAAFHVLRDRQSGTAATKPELLDASWRTCGGPTSSDGPTGSSRTTSSASRDRADGVCGRLPRPPTEEGRLVVLDVVGASFGPGMHEAFAPFRGRRGPAGRPSSAPRGAATPREAAPPARPPLRGWAPSEPHRGALAAALSGQLERGHLRDDARSEIEAWLARHA